MEDAGCRSRRGPCTDSIETFSLRAPAQGVSGLAFIDENAPAMHARFTPHAAKAIHNVKPWALIELPLMPQAWFAHN